jgi:hypothetical protein
MDVTVESPENRHLEKLLLDSLDDPRQAIVLTREFWHDVKKRFQERVERRKQRLGGE